MMLGRLMSGRRSLIIDHHLRVLNRLSSLIVNGYHRLLRLLLLRRLLLSTALSRGHRHSRRGLLIQHGRGGCRIRPGRRRSSRLSGCGRILSTSHRHLRRRLALLLLLLL